MRILLTIHNFLPEPTLGAENACLAQMRELRRVGHTVGLFYAGNEAPASGQLDQRGLEGITLFRVSYRPTKAQVLLSIRKPHVERAFTEALRAFKPDVIVFHHLVRLSLWLPVLAQRAGIPSAYVLHDFYPICPSYSLFAWDSDVCPGGTPLRCARCLFASRYAHRCPPGLDWLAATAVRLRERIVRRAVQAVDLFLSPSAAVPREMAARGLTLPSAAVLELGRESVPAAPPASHEDSVRFGYIGGVNRKKGLEVLASAFEGSLGRQLTIQGFRNESARQAFRAAHPGFEGRLELFDPSPEGFYRGVDVVVLPSLWLENQPMVVLEAFAHGRPVLASRIGGLPEMFQEGAGGRFFEPGDPLSLRRVARELAADPQSVRRLAEAIPGWPDWQAVTARLVNHLESLVRGRRDTT